jgi:hypothetical protein
MAETCPRNGCECRLSTNEFAFDATPSHDHAVPVDHDTVDGPATNWFLPWVPAEESVLSPVGPTEERVCRIHGIV